MNNVTNTATMRGRIVENWRRIRRSIRNYFILVFLLGLLFFAAFFNRIVNFVRPGEAGVIWEPFFGGTQTDRIYNEGLQLLWPWDKLYIYNLRVQQIPHEFDALSKNGLPIHFDVSIRFQLIRETLPVLHQEIGPDYVDKIVKPEVQAQVRKIVANYLPDEIYTSEGYLLPVIRQGAMAAMRSRNISLDDVLIKRMTLPEAIRSAIERKLSAEQLSLEYDYLLIKERKEADRRRIEATGIRDFQHVVAEGGIFNQYLNYRGIEATVELAKSPNSKTLIVGNRDNGLPLVFNLPVPEGSKPAAAPASSPGAPAAAAGKDTDVKTLLSDQTRDLLEEKRMPETRERVEEHDAKR